MKLIPHTTKRPEYAIRCLLCFLIFYPLIFLAAIAMAWVLLFPLYVCLQISLIWLQLSRIRDTNLSPLLLYINIIQPADFILTLVLAFIPSKEIIPAQNSGLPRLPLESKDKGFYTAIYITILLICVCTALTISIVK